MWFLDPCKFWKLFSLILLNASCTCEVLSSVQFSSVTQLRPIFCNPMDCSMPGFLVHHQFLELAQTHVHRVGDVVQPSVIPSSSCLQSFSASGSFPVSQFFTSGCQNIGVSASASSPSNEYSGLISLGWTGWISLQSKGLSRVFSTPQFKTSIFQHSAFFMVQLSRLWMTTGKTIALTIWTK